MDHEIKRHLVTIGNYLSDGEPTEDEGGKENPDEEGEAQFEVYFSKEDKLHWESITPLFYELPTSYLLNFLSQYLDRLEKICDNEALEVLGFYDDPDVIAIYEVDENGSLQIKLNAPIDKENFKSYVQVLKNHGFKFEPTKKSWYLPFGQRGQLDLLSYVRELDQLGITSFPIPSSELDLSSIDKVIGAIHSNELRDCIALKCFDDGKFSFYFALSSQLNMFFSNKSGILTGITEYNPEGHGRETYDLPFVEEILAKIKVHLPEYKVYLDEKLKDRIKKHQHYVEELKKPIPELVTKMADHITLFPYQNEGVRFLEKTGGNALIGDEMGLGKTIQALAWVAMKGKRALAIVPKVVRYNWTREAKTFFPRYFFEDTVFEITAESIREGLDLKNKNLVVVNYESFEKCLPFLRQGLFDTLIIDESHRIKSDKAKITKAIKSVADIFDHKILLSGTAVKNKKEELFNQLELVCPSFFNKKELKYGTIGGVWHKMRSIYIARQKASVLSDLPDKITSIAQIDGTHLPENYPQAIHQVSAFKNEMAIAKAGLTVEFVKEILESSDSCVLLFTDSLSAAKLMAKALAPYALLHHGDMSDQARENVKALFQNQNCSERVLVSTRQSLAVGATLTRADKVVFNDLPWSAADVRQAEDRAHRIGQKNTVNVYWITGHGNLWDDKISEIIKQKYALTKAINEGKQITASEREWMERPLSLEEILGDFWSKRRRSKFVSSSVSAMR